MNAPGREPGPPHEADRPEWEENCIQAVRITAADLALDPAALAAELAQGEVALLYNYLHSAAPFVEDLELRTSIDLLLYRLGNAHADW